MPSLHAQFRGELDTGWADELRPVGHAALLLLAAIADEVNASGDDGLRFRYVACSGKGYRAHLRVDERERRVMMCVVAELPVDFPRGSAPALASHLNSRLASGRFEPAPEHGALAFRHATTISRESEIGAIRRLVDAATLPLELFEVAARRVARQRRVRRTR